MADAVSVQRSLSARRVIGFACNQAFVFFLLFLAPDGVIDFGSLAVERFSLLSMLLFMVVGFALLGALRDEALRKVLSRPLLYVYAVVAAGGSLLVIVLPDGGLLPAVGQGLLVGLTSAFLLTAWGRSFDAQPTKVSVPEVFVGSLVGALVCLVFSLAVESSAVLVAVRLLPLASVVNIEIDAQGGDAQRDAPRLALAAQAISWKILAGTLLFGMAAGLMLVCDADPDVSSLSLYRLSLVLYGAFLIGALTLLLSDGFGRGAALNKSYRLSVFIMMVGVLLVPWPFIAESALSGKAVVLAGFLGLEAVLVSLFLVIAEIAGTDCARSFSAGFLALFLGEFAGALSGLLMQGGIPNPTASQAVVVLAGAIVLVAYVFLFTEGDFDALSQLVTESDSIAVAHEAIVGQFGLSNREAEILVFALKGRTSERIAQELVISKSTVDTHLRRIYAKCDVHSRQELLDLAESYSAAER